jgi:hypothetical protein
MCALSRRATASSCLRSAPLPAGQARRDSGLLQGVLRQLTEAGTASSLPVDLHWSIRTLLPPRPAAAAGCPTQRIQAAQAAPAPAPPPAAASAASTHAQAVPAPTGAAACVQLSGLGFNNLLAQQVRHAGTWMGVLCRCNDGAVAPVVVSRRQRGCGLACDSACRLC